MKNLILLIAITCTTLLSAQNFQGKVTYKSHRKMDFKIDEKDQNTALKNELKAQLAKQFQKEFTLEFTRTESLFRTNESLASPVPSSSGISITVSGGNDILYKNIKDKRYTRASEIFGKQFLIKDTLQSRQWNILGDTKKIGEYTCRKAVFKDTYTTQTITESGTIETVEKERETIAWFTLQIPVSHGPADFFGLPGLILEVHDGEQILLCTKIIINPKDKIIIKEPKKGKEVSQNKFNTIRKEKSEESIKQFYNRRKR